MVRTTAAHLSDLVPIEDVGANPRVSYAQHDLSDADVMLRDTVVDGPKLGDGTFGSVYACTVRGRRLTLKLPTRLLQLGKLFFRNQRLLSRTPTHAGRGADAVAAQTAKAQADFAYEFAIGERVVDTPTMRHAQAAPGAPVRCLSEEEYARHEEEHALRRAHPGFQHLVHVVHYCASYPCLLMAPCCDGDAYALYRQNDLMPHSDALARHTLLAMEYLRDLADVANTDIKLQNVLFQGGGAGIRFVLCDYGGCARVDAPWIEHHVRTPGYCPPESAVEAFGLPVWDPRAVRPFPVSAYAFAAMLMYILLPGCRPTTEPCAKRVTEAQAPALYREEPMLEAALRLLRAPPDEVEAVRWPELRGRVPGLLLGPRRRSSRRLLGQHQ